MFENSLIDAGARGRHARRLMTLPVAVAFHLAAVASVCFAQYWQADRLVEPDLNVVFLAPAPMPELREAAPQRPAAPAGPQRPSKPAAGPPAPAPPPGPVQPPSVPDVIPPVPTQLEQTEPGTGDPRNPGVLADLDGPFVPGNGGDGPGGPSKGSGGEGPGGGGDDIVYRPGNGVSRPVAIVRVKPRYTEAARKARLQGTVVLEAMIDETGQVRDAQVLKKLPMGLDQAAIDAVLQWRYEPSRYEGRPVRVLVRVTVDFALS